MPYISWKCCLLVCHQLILNHICYSGRYFTCKQHLYPKVSSQRQQLSHQLRETLEASTSKQKIASLWQNGVYTSEDILHEHWVFLLWIWCRQRHPIIMLNHKFCIWRIENKVHSALWKIYNNMYAHLHNKFLFSSLQSKVFYIRLKGFLLIDYQIE